MLDAVLNLRNVVENFSPNDDIRHALLLTYNFDGQFLEDPERGLLETLWQRNCTNVLIVRDGKAVIEEKRSHRYSAVNAAYSMGTFHPKLLLLISESEALAAVGSANLTRGGLEKNLELTCVYSLTRTGGPNHLFEAIRGYLHNYLGRELEKASNHQREAFKTLLKDFDRFLGDARPAHGSAKVHPSFLHNYEEPLLPQIVRELPSTQLDELWIVSPFFEPETGSTSDDPSTEDLDR